MLLGKIKKKVLIIHPHKRIIEIPRLPSSVRASIQIDGSLELSFDRSLISTEDLIDLCREQGISIQDIATSEPALEDVFKLAIKD